MLQRLGHGNCGRRRLDLGFLQSAPTCADEYVERPCSGARLYSHTDRRPGPAYIVLVVVLFNDPYSVKPHALFGR